jgi:apolipoprotein N-acyltransferase
VAPLPTDSARTAPALAIGAVLGCGALLALAYRMHPAWAAAWIAPVPLLWLAYRGARHTYAMGLAAGLIGLAPLYPYYAAVAGAMTAAVIVLLRALAWAFVVRYAAGAMRRLPPAAGVWAYPAAWAALETLVAAVSPHGTYGSLAYSQMDFLPALQVAALGGAPAVTFLVSLFASAAALALSARPGALRALLLPAVLLVAALLYGAERSSGPAEPGGAAVAMVASDANPGIAAGWEAGFAPYVAAIDAAVASGARIVVLPEKTAHLTGAEGRAAAARLSAIAQARNIDLVAGVLVDEAGGQRNRALVADASGLVATYDKRHLVPGIEGAIRPGSSDLVLHLRDGTIGVAICKDMDFSALGRGYASAGARLMLVPGWDFRGPWGEDGWAHGRLAVLRGVESGYAVVRSAREGLLVASDRYGRVLAEAASAPQATMLLARVPVAGAPTPYVMLGDLFGWLCVAGCVALRLRGGPL